MGTLKAGKRKYTVSPAAVAQRTAAGGKPRGGTRTWTNVRVSSNVIEAIDAKRGDVSRNEYLAHLLNCKD